jgi:hypothetical protein
MQGMEGDVLLVTFASNVWRSVADPSRFPNDSMHAAVSRIYAAILAGGVQGRLSETIFTLETIRRVDRRTFFGSYKPEIGVEESELANGTIRLQFTIGPNPSAHPGNNPYLTSHLSDALAAGFRLMRCPQVGSVMNPDLNPEWLVSGRNPDWANKFGEVGRKLESLGVGRARITAIGSRFAPAGAYWTQGLAMAPATEDKGIASAIAEWADGDTVSAHVAYENHYLCTRDVGKGSIDNSVFSKAHRAWLERDYGIAFVTPDDLIKRACL